MWPQLPLEFNVIGTPVSFQSDNSRAKAAWKNMVLTAALSVVESGSWAFSDTRLAVTLFYFPQEDMPGDVDNIVKLVVDALIPNIYIDDEVVDRVVVQRFSPSQEVRFAEPSAMLVAAMALKEPVLYVRIAEVSLEDIRP
ncbi:MAG: RusA family crossover junction endodeoxyribonuclease [Parvibaculum sp.]|nr:RusA family crossover junction endodeoxyribonuclease [Parvibaculum sp.]